MTKPHLEALTSIRFFAAAMIVTLHSQAGVFGLPRKFLDGFPLDEGVGLFFVLSGFIMTYVYPDLSAPGARRKFLVARIARIWPLHLFMLGVVLVAYPYHMIFEWDTPYPENLLVLASNALLLQAWVPAMDYFWSGNAVSWSISVELFFYIAFTFLIRDFAQTWGWKLLGVFMIWILIFTACRFLEIPGYSSGDLGVTTVGLLYVNPLARLPEFVTGMAVGVFFNRLVAADRIDDLGRVSATVLEVGAIAMCALAMYANVLYKEFAGSDLTHVVRLWIGNGGVCFFWAALVLIFATGRGYLARALSNRVFVHLGDISFAIYMCHEVIIKIYIAAQGRHWEISAWIQFPIFLAVLLLSSHLLWKYIELPSRRLIVNRLTPKDERT